MVAVDFRARPRLGLWRCGQSMDTLDVRCGPTSDRDRLGNYSASPRRTPAKGLRTRLVFPAQEHAGEKSGGERENGALPKKPQPTQSSASSPVSEAGPGGGDDPRRFRARPWTTNAANPTAQRRDETTSSAPAAPSMGAA